MVYFWIHNLDSSFMLKDIIYHFIINLENMYLIRDIQKNNRDIEVVYLVNLL